MFLKTKTAEIETQGILCCTLFLKVLEERGKNHQRMMEGVLENLLEEAARDSCLFYNVCNSPEFQRILQYQTKKQTMNQQHNN